MTRTDHRSRLARSTRVGAIACLSLLATTMTVQTASADTTTKVNWTEIGIYPRASPSMDSPRAGSALSDGTAVTIACETEGQPVSNGVQTITIWDQLVDGTWLPNAFLDTGTDSWTPGVPRCGDDTSASVEFNRTAATQWALANAQDWPPDWYYASGCTYFVSNALWAGGLPQDDVWTSSGEHGTVRRVPGSVTAWSAPEFLSYLQSHYVVDQVPLNFSANAVPAAEIGDVIAYDWEGDGHVDHLALVTNIAAGEYPEVSEWGTGRSIPGLGGAATYQKRGWTYSEDDKGWLQAFHPNVTATLYHIEGTLVLPSF